MMNYGKKLLCGVLFAAMLTLALTACGATQTQDADGDNVDENAAADNAMKRNVPEALGEDEEDWLLDEDDYMTDYTGEEFVGDWEDSESRRAMLSIEETDEPGVYDVLVHWGGSYNSAMQWRMTAVAGAQDEILSYENGQKVEVVFRDDGSGVDETVYWDDASGYFIFEDGFLRWYDDKEEGAEDCLFVAPEYSEYSE